MINRFFSFGYWERPGCPIKNNTNAVPAVNPKSPSKDQVNLGSRPFTPTHEYQPGHNGIKKP